jgi:hypothetical protein
MCLWTCMLLSLQPQNLCEEKPIQMTKIERTRLSGSRKQKHAISTSVSFSYETMEHIKRFLVNMKNTRLVFKDV